MKKYEKSYDPIFTDRTPLRNSSHLQSQTSSPSNSTKKVNRGGKHNPETYEAIDLNSHNDFIVKNNMKILSKKDPIYHYHNLDEDIRKPKIDTLSKILNRRLQILGERENQRG